MDGYSVHFLFLEKEIWTMPHFRINNLKLETIGLTEELFLERLRIIIPKEYYLSSEQIGNKKIYKTDFPIGKLFEHTLGFIYIQSKSSMLSALALNPISNEKVLDLCSAPGSKTTLLAEMMNNQGFILANEISLDRIKALLFNIDRLGIINTTICNYDGNRIYLNLINYFDKVLVDPPCTALGDLKFTSKKKMERNISRIDSLTKLQFQLLVSAAKMVKVNGEIIYSTCTTTLEENEYLIDKFLSKYPFEIIETKLHGIHSKNETGKQIRMDLFNSIRIDPTDDDEGFFIVKLKKLDDFDNERRDKTTISFNHRNELLTYDSIKIQSILQQISDAYGIEFEFWKNYLYLLRSGDLFMTSINDFDYNNIKFLRTGIKLASLDKKIGWRLSSNSIQIIGNKITKNIIYLQNKEQLKSYFMGQKTPVNEPDCDFVTVKYGDYFLGSGKVKSSVLLSYFPRSRRTLEIDFSLIQNLA